MKSFKNLAILILLAAVGLILSGCGKHEVTGPDQPPVVEKTYNSYVVEVLNDSDSSIECQLQLSAINICDFGKIAPGKRVEKDVRVEKRNPALMAKLKINDKTRRVPFAPRPAANELVKYFVWRSGDILGPSQTSFEKTVKIGGASTEKPVTVNPGEPAAKNPAVKKPAPGMTDAQKQKAIYKARINIMRTFVCSQETIEDGHFDEPSDEARDMLTEYLAKLGFKVIQSTKQLGFSPTEAQQDEFRKKYGCNIAFLLKANVSPRKSAGRHRAYYCKLNGKVLNLETHQIIAQKKYDEYGAASQYKDTAAKNAIDASVKKLEKYLSAEAVRKWEELTLYKVKIDIWNVVTSSQADCMRVGLQRRKGVYYVSLDNWSQLNNIATYEVLIRRDCKDQMIQYLNALRDKGLQTRAWWNKGEKIEAIRPDLN